MNVGSSSGQLLPQKMSGTAASSKSRIDEDYVLLTRIQADLQKLQQQQKTVDVKSKDLPSPSPSPSLLPQPASTKCPQSGSNDGVALSTGDDPVDSGSAKQDSKSASATPASKQLKLVLDALGKSKETVANALKLEYLRAIGDTGALVSSSNHYVTVGSWTAFTYAAPITGQDLNNLGVAVSDPEFGRTSNTICMKHLKLRVAVLAAPVDGKAGVNWWPKCYVTVWREKLPAVASKTPEFTPYGTGQNPPSGNYYLLYDRLGTAQDEANQIAVRNPFGTMGAEVYKRHYFDTGNHITAWSPGVAAAGNIAAQVMVPRIFNMEWDIPVNRYQHYQDVTATQPLDNRIWLAVEIDRDLANANCAMFYQYSSKLSFESVQDIDDPK